MTKQKRSALTNAKKLNFKIRVCENLFQSTEQNAGKATEARKTGHKTVFVQPLLNWYFVITQKKNQT